MSDNSNKRYLFFVTLEYSYTILRPIQDEIISRGGQAAWFIESGCKDLLKDGEKRLSTIAEVVEYNPYAVFAPGNHIYDFFPGIKVSVFHGYPIYKRGNKPETHFKIRNWFDIYCSSGESSTPTFASLEEKYGSFKVYETGWSKVDSFATLKRERVGNDRVKVIYSTTFTKNITSAPILLDKIRDLATRRDWDWIISIHPKFNDTEVLEKYKQLASELDNVEFVTDGVVTAEILNQADVMLCDSSSVILEFLLFDKPVVTFRNTTPGKHLLNVENIDEVEAALDIAIAQEAPLMEDMKRYINFHEAHTDGKNCARILDAVDDFSANFRGSIKPRRLDFIRRYKLRRKCGFTFVQAILNILGKDNLKQIKLK